MKGPGTYQLSDEVLTGVILGCRIDDHDEKEIAFWLKKRKKKMRVYRAKTKKDKFGLDIIELHNYY
ncbi:hypothetical protein L0337_18535 [candidate division KSB1 bacterium]|nr:hypothetical protein [candidate division KSB1 bacterium]